jgi:hypothetical protein
MLCYYIILINCHKFNLFHNIQFNVFSLYQGSLGGESTSLSPAAQILPVCLYPHKQPEDLFVTSYKIQQTYLQLVSLVSATVLHVYAH